MDNLLDADSVHVVYITIPRDDADKLARRLVEKRLAACVSVSPKVESYYLSKGKIKRDEEARVICKTVAKKFNELVDFVSRSHPYDVPEIISFPVANGLPEYIAWVHEQTESLE